MSQDPERPAAGPALGNPAAATTPSALVLLTLGAILGLAMAAVGLLSSAATVPPPLGPEEVARVNGTSIRRDAYERVLAGLAADARNPIDDQARRHVLDRMIDEELLVQRAVGLGLLEIDRRVRADLTSSLISSVVMAAEEREPSRSELEAFFREQQAFFTQPGRYRVQQVYFRVAGQAGEDAARARADQAREALLSGRPLGEVAEELGDEPVSRLPDTLLPALKLREYLGPRVLEAVMALRPGEISAPVRSGVGVHLLLLVDASPAATPAFEQVEEQVRAEWRRRVGDRALRSYLDELRRESRVLTRDDLQG